MMRLWIVLLVSLSVFVGCSSRLESVSFCGDRGRRIVDGIVTNDYSSVIKIKTARGGSCTGTLVSENTVITAGHCTDGSNLGGILYNGVASQSAVVSKRHTSEVDLAVVVFPEETFSSNKYVELNSSPPQAGDTITLVGYGQTDFVNDNNTDGNKRVGCNRVVGYANVSRAAYLPTSETGNYLHFVSPLRGSGIPGENSMTGSGDSGGPIFFNGKLTAVVAFGGVGLGYGESKNDDLIYEYDTNLLNGEAQHILRRAISEIGAKITGLQ